MFSLIAGVFKTISRVVVVLFYNFFCIMNNFHNGYDLRQFILEKHLQRIEAPKQRLITTSLEQIRLTL